jgi:UDP-N-acetylglucosamine--N-acetylmuramyl-(pentapeptide) pyrophosphoryl-undecaprenol N-acetylglucosamine transferase
VTRGRIQVTGNPVRAEIMAGSRERGRRWLGVAEGRPVVLVTGGSTGARALNQAVEACRERLALCCHLVHQRGRHPGVDRLPGYQSAPFYGQVFPDLLAAADLVVCRAGANSLSELSAWGLPAILVPLPLSSSRGDQIANAAHRARAGAAVVLNQADLDGDRLAREIMGLLDAPMRLHAMRQASAALAQPGAAALIAGVLMAVARRPHAGRRRARRPAGT